MGSVSPDASSIISSERVSLVTEDGAQAACDLKDRPDIEGGVAV